SDFVPTDTLFRKDGSANWAVVPGSNSVSIRRSTDGIKWSTAYSITKSTAVVDVCSTTPNGTLQVFFTETGTGKKYRIWLPSTYAPFGNNELTLSPGLHYKGYTYTDASTTHFGNLVTDRILTNQNLNFDWGTGANTLISGSPYDYFSHMATGFFIVPSSIPSGRYRMRYQANDCLGTWFNGRILNSTPWPDTKQFIDGPEITLEPGAVFPFVSWYVDLWGPAFTNVQFIRTDNGVAYELPGSAFYTDTGQAGSMEQTMMDAWIPGVRVIVYDNQINESDRYIRGWFISPDFAKWWGGGRPADSMDDNYFAVLETASLFIKNPGNYNFYADTDDGHEWYLDGIHQGGGLYTRKVQSSKSLSLSTGLHPLSLAMIEWEGDSGINITVNGKTPGTADRTTYIQLIGKQSTDYAKVQSVQVTPNAIVKSNPEIRLTTPSNNQVVSGKPTLIWTSTVEAPNFEVRLLKTAGISPDSIRSLSDLLCDHVMDSKTATSITLDWKDTLTPGEWMWQVSTLTPAGDRIQSSVGVFEVS
ncbi:hypothetical protein EBR96_08970, partial [bacterium]|nr:hypothetical protein [bacterium]